MGNDNSFANVVVSLIVLCSKNLDCNLPAFRHQIRRFVTNQSRTDLEHLLSWHASDKHNPNLMTLGCLQTHHGFGFGNANCFGKQATATTTHLRTHLWSSLFLFFSSHSRGVVKVAFVSDWQPWLFGVGLESLCRQQSEPRHAL
jgi:hypothetical protein